MKRLLLIGFSTSLAIVALGGASAAASSPVSDLAHIGKARSTSTNWSGYAAFNTTFSHVKGDWTVPTVNCSSMKGKQTAIATAFVGLDGYLSRTVEQSGTDSDCLGSTPFYIAWYEFYPAGAVFLDQGTYPVNHGDHMHAEATVSGGNVTLTLQNVTQGWTLTPSPSISSSGLDLSSAEWILEAPAQKLANFGSINFTGAHATDATHSDAAISSFPSNDAITMVSKNGRTTRATPSALGGGGDNFSVTFNNP
jgi:peptidase A4-like protein